MWQIFQKLQKFQIKIVSDTRHNERTMSTFMSHNSYYNHLHILLIKNEVVLFLFGYRFNLRYETLPVCFQQICFLQLILCLIFSLRNLYNSLTILYIQYVCCFEEANMTFCLLNTNNYIFQY